MAPTRTASRLANWLAISMVASLLVIVPSTPAWSAPTELFISEYIEGSSNNKAIEIYNGTGAAIDLAAGGYDIQMFFNGNATAGLTIALTGTVADGDVYVVAHSSAGAAIAAQADQTNGSGWFNGDDAVALRQDGVIVDVIGQVGFDPGTQWGDEVVSTADNTLRRKAGIEAGDTNPSDAFDPAVEWDGFAEDTFDGLGFYGDPPSDPAVLVINEIDYDQPSTDTAEYIEIKNVGATEADLSLFSLDLVNGSGAVVYDTVSLTGSLAAGDYFVVCANAATVANCDLDDGPNTNFIQNGEPDAVALLESGVVVDTVSYEGDTGAPYTEGSGSGLVDDPNLVDFGISRCPDGTDTDQNNVDFESAASTPGVGNDCDPPPPPTGMCGDPATFIHDVQGPGLASPLVGATVFIEGIVVGDFQNNASADNGDLDGFHVQEEDGDADTDPLTSEGIFVFAPGGDDVSVGDQVRVVGDVSEFFGRTEIGSGGILECSEGNSPPTPGEVALPVTDLDDHEAFESMSVVIPQDLTIAEYFNFGRFGEIVLTTDRQATPTAIVEPGMDAIDLAAEYQLARITLDDGRGTQNPDPAIHPNGGEFDLNNLFRGGDIVSNVTGVMDFAFGLYRVQPTQGADYLAANPRPEAHDAVGGTLEVASFNVLNYFTTLGDDCGPAGGQDCRGADNVEELERQRAKIVAALAAMESDVVGLIEIENNPGDGPTADLVDGLNAELGAGTYDYIATGAIGTDAIRQAFIYKPGAVTPLGDFAILDSTVDPEFLDTFNRPVLAQTFMDNATGGVFTVAVNHLKSKGSDCNDIGDPDIGDGSGNCNVTRTRAAQALVDWLATDPTGSGDDDFLIIGDLNAYDKEAPIDAITAAGYSDLIRQYQGEEAYSFVFDGQVGYLDHGLAASDLVDEVTGATIWHINADEPNLIDYDTSFKQDAQDAIYAPDAYRSSDHDPVIVGLAVCDEIAPQISVGVSKDVLWPPNHKYHFVTATVIAMDNFDPTPTVELVSVTSDEPDNGPDDGNTVNDIVIVDDDTFKLRAERSGSGDGRVYSITYRATDDCGTSTLATATVLVPLEKSSAGG